MHCGAGHPLANPVEAHQASYPAALHQGLTAQSALRTQANNVAPVVVGVTPTDVKSNVVTTESGVVGATIVVVACARVDVVGAGDAEVRAFGSDVVELAL